MQPSRRASATPALQPLQRALGRLELSRARLHTALAPATPAGDAAGAVPWPLLGRARAWLLSTPWGSLLEPVVSTVGQESLRWWRRQPWQQAVVQAGHALQAELSPLVRRHPLAAVLVTATAGAIVAGSGVWRWHTVRRSALHLGLRLRRAFISQISSPAVQSLMLGALVSFLATRRPAAGPATHPAAEAQAPNAERGSNARNARPSAS